MSSLSERRLLRASMPGSSNAPELLGVGTRLWRRGGGVLGGMSGDSTLITLSPCGDPLLFPLLDVAASAGTGCCAGGAGRRRRCGDSGDGARERS